MASGQTGLSRLFRGAAPEATVSETSATALDGAALATVVKIVELQLRQVALDTLTAEVLPAMLTLFEAPAGALLLYRREDATLTLAAARGMPVDGAASLEILRWGEENGSEMPLRALVDRKIYVVDRPDDDAFTRKLIGDDQRRTPVTVAAVPLYRWHLPVGVMLVIGGPTPLTPEALLAPSFTYSVLALGLSTMLWAKDVATPLPASDVAPPPLICVPWIDHRNEISNERKQFEAERDAGIAAAQAEGRQALEDGIAVVRAEHQAALEAGIAAAREESRSAMDAMLQELRAAVSGIAAEREANAQERATLSARIASFEQEHTRLADKVATAETDRTSASTRMETLEEEINRRVTTALAAQATASPPAAEAPAQPAAAAPPPPPMPAAAKTPAAPAPPPPVVGGDPPSAPPVERRVLESDATLLAHIQTALATAIPAGRGSVAAVNLIGCNAARVAEMTDAAAAGMVVVGYASDPERGSRILGPLRCFVEPPTAAETAGAIDGNARGNRRTILLSEDIDAFLVAKTALTKAGHSVSMACDEKQALDLLAILRPDTVVVDVRGAGQPTVEFLDALGPESGRILTLLVHGDASGATLARLGERMLRPPKLDVNELVKICRNALPEPKRPGAAPAKPTR